MLSNFVISEEISVDVVVVVVVVFVVVVVVAALLPATTSAYCTPFNTHQFAFQSERYCRIICVSQRVQVICNCCE